MIATAIAGVRRHPFLQLLFNQVAFDIRLKYLGSVAGIYWALINPLLYLATLYFLMIGFKVYVGPFGGRIEYLVFVLAGMAPWLAFQEGLVSSSSSILRSAALVKSMVFPLEILPVSAVISSLIGFGVTFIVLLVLIALGGVGFGSSIVLLPFVFAIQLLMTLGLGFLLVVVTTVIRDVAQILPLVLQYVMIATPIFYHRDALPPTLQKLESYNPLYHLTESYRRMLVTGTWPSWEGLLYISVIAALLFTGGWVIFRQSKPYFEGMV